MKNDSTDLLELLDLTDEDSSIIDYCVEGSIKRVVVKKNLSVLSCPLCGARLNSKGLFERHPNHQIFQDGYKLEIIAIGRRWKCSNDDCNYSYTDQFSFIEKNKKNTKIIELLIVKELKDLNKTCRDVARMFNVSDTYVHETFMRYVDLPRLPLTSIIAIDEVCLNISPKFKYAIVIMDFLTGDLIDVLPSRRKEITQSYFLNVPKEERDGVRYLICDMYNPYINYSNTYFKKSEVIVDSFHVIQYLLKQINQYIKSVKDRYLARDRKQLKEENYKSNKQFVKRKDSREVFIIKHAKWVLLKNESNINYSFERHYCRYLNQYLDTFDWKREFMSLDDQFEKIKYYKDLYEEFNSQFANDYEGAGTKLDELIEIYKSCDVPIFQNFAKLLTTYKKQIINSFTYVSKDETVSHHSALSRLSNGPLESYNNKPSKYLSDSHGLANFEFSRNRLLWSNRDNASILGVPKSNKEIHNHTYTVRGNYNKH